MAAGTAGEALHGANAAVHVERLRMWLDAARKRLGKKDYAAFGGMLRVLRQRIASRPSPGDMVKHSADEAQRDCEPQPLPVRLLLDIAALLWRADFPEGRRAQAGWLLEFGESLPPALRPDWPSTVQCAAPTPMSPPGVEAVDLSKDWKHGGKGGDGETAEMGGRIVDVASDVASSKRRRAGAGAGPPQPPEALSSGPANEAPAQALCVMCRHPPCRPKVAVLCGHFACGECWDRWMVLKFECPVCRKKARPGNLVQVRGWGDT
mmetsp:Transcript_87898/g.246895  ORF Transcript_87898/g.246895 Transcript_87898/m.246895 type:complete len:264 (-) Transcript_87898:41-832(-)